MSKLTDLKMEYNERLDSLPPALEEEKLQHIEQLIRDTPDLEYHIKRLKCTHVLQGMTLACTILFNEFIDQL